MEFSVLFERRDRSAHCLVGAVFIALVAEAFGLGGVVGGGLCWQRGQRLFWLARVVEVHRCVVGSVRHADAPPCSDGIVVPFDPGMRRRIQSVAEELADQASEFTAPDFRDGLHRVVGRLLCIVFCPSQP